MHCHYHHIYHNYLVFSLAVTHLFKIFFHQTIILLLTPCRHCLLLTHHWHSLCNSLDTDKHVLRKKSYNARNYQGKVHETEQMKLTSVCQSVTKFLKFWFLERNWCNRSADEAVIWKIAGSKSRTGSVSHTASRSVRTSLLPLGKSGRFESLTTHLYRAPRCWCTINSFRRCYVCSSKWNLWKCLELRRIVMILWFDLGLIQRVGS